MTHVCECLKAHVENRCNKYYPQNFTARKAAVEFRLNTTHFNFAYIDGTLSINGAHSRLHWCIYDAHFHLFKPAMILTCVYVLRDYVHVSSNTKKIIQYIESGTEKNY